MVERRRFKEFEKDQLMSQIYQGHWYHPSLRLIHELIVELKFQIKTFTSREKRNHQRWSRNFLLESRRFLDQVTKLRLISAEIWSKNWEIQAVAVPLECSTIDQIQPNKSMNFRPVTINKMTIENHRLTRNQCRWRDPLRHVDKFDPSEEFDLSLHDEDVRWSLNFEAHFQWILVDNQENEFRIRYRTTNHLAQTKVWSSKMFFR